jgi:hypothetical protein
MKAAAQDNPVGNNNGRACTLNNNVHVTPH